MFTDLNIFFSSPLIWFWFGAVSFAVTYSIDLVEHGIFIGIPALIMALIAPFVGIALLNLLVYSILMVLFYHFCQQHRDWFHGSDDDINDN